jgi:eukaryotic-like serine/threonine-protein kinase
MPQTTRLECSQGHEWDVEMGSLEVKSASDVCPVCGGPSRSQISSETGSTADLGDELPPPPPRREADEALPELAVTLNLPGSGRRRALDDAPPIAGYQILSELGRGGMGVVYHARQASLGREVALKIILAGAHAGQSERARFRVEAETAARLKHPNIVPIYEIGEQGQLPYLALEFVEGGSLAQAMAVRPLAPIQAAGMVETLARAIDHVHQHGVVHRDLKPANVLLTADGVPKITDFGLAKWLDAPSDHATQSGTVLGTPSYMAPEQAQGHSGLIGPATDVYALGAILYEMVTGRPPFHAATSQETVQQLLTEEPLPPSRLQPRVPRDLEIICLKCLQKEPTRRYAGAGALADDLRRFLDQKPIHARPTPAWERALKWARRRPAIAGLAGISIAASLALAVTGLAYNARLQRERDTARANFQMALDAVDRFYNQVSENTLLNTPRMEPLRRQLLETAQEFYERFVRERANDPEARVQLGRTYQRLGQLTRQTKSKTEAIEFMKQAIAIQEPLVRAHPDNSEYQSDLAISHANLGGLLGETGRMDEAAQQFRKTIPLWEALVRRNPSLGVYRQRLGHTWFSLGEVCRFSAKSDEARQAHGRARSVLEALVQDEPKVADHGKELALLINAQAALAFSAGAYAEAGKAFGDALALREVLAREFPDRHVLQHDLAASHANLAIVARINNDWARAETSNKSALDIFQRLAREHPDISDYRDGQAGPYQELGLIYFQKKDLKHAEQSLREAVAIRAAVAHDRPEVTRYQSGLARTYIDLGELCIETGQPGEAETSLSQACEIMERLVHEYPDVIDYQADLGCAYAAKGKAAARSAKPLNVVDFSGKAINLLDTALRNKSSFAEAQQYLGMAYRERAEAYGGLGRTDDALRDWEKAVPLSEGEDLTAARIGRARTLARLGEHARAAAEVEDVARAKPALAFDLYRSAGVYAAAVAACLRDGKPDRQGDDALAQRYAARALELLAAAQAAGYFNAPDHLDAFHKDPSFDPLRSRTDFKAWATRLGPTSPMQSGPPSPRP